MKHGIEPFFRERLRASRRVSLTTFVLGCVLLGLQLLALVPAVRERLQAPPRRVVRFGYEGPDRVVEQIHLNARPGRQDPLRDIGHVEALPSRKGGAGLRPARGAPTAGPTRNSRLPGPGEDDLDIMARSRLRRASVPMVQSDELVIESMEEPEYPPELHERGVEGRVGVMALVDTTGRVAEVTVVESSGELAFEQSAAQAVRQARFKPYRIDGAPHEVYAVIRYRFRIY